MAQIRISVSDIAVIAETNPDAPQTVAAFLGLLPWRQKLVHVRWSGEAMWVPLGDWKLGVGFENHTSHPSVGDVLLYPGGNSETELLIAYGPCSFASKMGPLAGNHFLTIIGQRDALRELGRRVLYEGAQQVRFELEPEGQARLIAPRSGALST